MRLSTFLKPFSFLPALIMMYMIYSFSAQEADVSSHISYGVSRQIVTAADKVLDLHLDSWQIEDYAYRLEGRVRKFAHMGEYFLLAITVSFPLYVYGLRGILLMLFAGLFCVIYAGSDEYHQTMVLGRSGSPRDVMIDSIGIFAGVLFTRIIGFIGRKTIFRPLSRSSRPSRRQNARARRQEQKEIQRMREEREREDYERCKAQRRMAKERSRSVHTDKDAYSDRPYADERYPGDRYPHEQPRDDRYDSDDRRRRYEEYYPEDGYLDEEDYPNDYPEGGYLDDDYPGNYPDDTSDELSEDMPLSHLLRHDRR